MIKMKTRIERGWRKSGCKGPDVRGVVGMGVGIRRGGGNQAFWGLSDGSWPGRLDVYVLCIDTFLVGLTSSKSLGQSSLLQV